MFFLTAVTPYVSAVDTLLGFLSFQQTHLGYPAVRLQVHRQGERQRVDWGNRLVNTVYDLAARHRRVLGMPHFMEPITPQTALGR